MTHKDWNMETDVSLWSELADSFKKKAQAQGQTAPAPRVDQAIVTARKLIHNVQRELSNSAPMPNISVTPPEGQTGDTSLKADNLNNLDNLLIYMHNNKLAVDGQQVVYTPQDLGGNDEQVNQKVDEMGLAVLDGKTERETDQRGTPNRPGQQGAAPTRRWITQRYYFKQELLVKYVEYLRQKGKDLAAKPDGTAEHSTGQMLGVYVGRLIMDLRQRRQINIPLPQRSLPGQPTSMPDDTIVDTFTVKNFDPKNPGRWDGGPIQLHAGNLKSQEALNAWLQGKGDQDKMGNSNGVAKVAGDQGAWADYYSNPCAVIQTLYRRSQASRNFQTTADGRKGAEYYFAQIQVLGPQFQDANGNACTLTVTQQPAQQQDGYQQQGAGQGPSAAVLQELVDALPFDLADIDFRRINDFLDKYQSLILPTVDSSRQANVSNGIQQARSLMRKILPMTRGGRISNFPVDGLTPNTVMSWGADPPSTYARPILDSLDLLVRSVGTVVRDFWQSYARGSGRNQQIFTENQRNQVEEQILGSSILQENISMLSAARLRLPQAGQTGQR